MTNFKNVTTSKAKTRKDREPEREQKAKRAETSSGKPGQGNITKTKGEKVPRLKKQCMVLNIKK